MLPPGFPGLPTGWTAETRVFPSLAGGTHLFATWYRRATGPRALFVVHGLGEHGGRYLHFPHYLGDVVDSVFCLDYRGHGRADGLRGHVTRFDELVDDVSTGYAELETALRAAGHGNPEIHLYAHSLGGLIALRWLARGRPGTLRSATISAPLLRIRVELPLAKRAAARALSRIWPRLLMQSEIDPADLSRDPGVGITYMQDRLVHTKGTPRFYTELLAALRETKPDSARIGVPTLFSIPLDDRVVDPEAGLRFAERVEIAGKRVKTWPGFRHEPHNEIGREAVFAEVADWIRAH